MGASRGYRSRTRHKFKRPFRQNGTIRMKRYLQSYKIGEYVDIVVDGSQHRGMPHHMYHGKTGRIFNVSPRSLGVIIKKEVRNRIEIKRLNVRIEHIRKSNSRTAFTKRIQENDRKKAEAKKAGKRISTKRQNAQPRVSHVLSFKIEDMVAHNLKPFIEIH